MVVASFIGRSGALEGFRVCGHSGYADAGQDIVCAAVSALTMYTANLLAEEFGLSCTVDVDEDSATISLFLEERAELGSKILAAFKKELVALAEEYPQNILVKE